MKACTTCGEPKQNSDFSPDKRAKDGLQGRCRLCCANAKRARYYKDVEATRQRRRAVYAKDKERILASNSASRERHRDSVLAGKKDYYERVKVDPKWQERQSFLRSINKTEKSRYDAGYRERNAEKCAANSKAWRERNPEKRAAISKAYRARRRAGCAGGDSTAEICKWEVAAAKVCYWCGKDCKNSYHVDHYQPLAKGGAHAISNLVIACPRCNLKKNAKDPYEFAASMGRLF